MIRGYAEQPSPRAGDRLVLRVATGAPQFRVEPYRCGTALVLYDRSPWLPGQDAPLHLPFEDWGTPGVGLRGAPLAPWPAYPLAIPAEWASGVYVAVLVEGDGMGRDASQPDRTTPDGRDAKALFIVRPAPGRTASILYKIPLLTYHAYNLIDGEAYDAAAQHGHWCLYNHPRRHEVPRQVPSGWGYTAPAEAPARPRTTLRTSIRSTQRLDRRSCTGTRASSAGWSARATSWTTARTWTSTGTALRCSLRIGCS